jgi:hypothetical protein
MGTRDTALHPTPWHVEGNWIVDAEDFPVGSLFTAEDAERAAAAVNACARVPVAMLKGGVVERLIEKNADALEAEAPLSREGSPSH